MLKMECHTLKSLVDSERKLVLTQTKDLVDSARDDIGKLANEVCNLREEITMIRAADRVLKKDMAKLQVEHSQVRSRYDEEVQETRNNLETLAGQIKSFIVSGGELEQRTQAQLVSIQETMASWKASQRTMLGDINGPAGEVLALKSLIHSESKLILAQAGNLVDTTRNDLARLTDDMRKLKEESSMTRSQIDSDVQSRLTLNDSLMNTARKDVTTLQDEFRTMRRKMDDVSSGLKKAVTERTDAIGASLKLVDSTVENKIAETARLC